jgi:hypothetical protein
MSAMPDSLYVYCTAIPSQSKYDFHDEVRCSYAPITLLVDERIVAKTVRLIGGDKPGLGARRYSSRIASISMGIGNINA